MKNQLLITVVVTTLVGGASFYGGMQYQKRQLPSLTGNVQFNNQRGARNGQNTMVIKDGKTVSFRPVSGEIINQDDTSVTVKMPDGSTKLIFLSESTKINKTSEGSKTDLSTGQEVTVMGTENADGSITAQTISLGSGMFKEFRTVNQEGPTPSPTQ